MRNGPVIQWYLQSYLRGGTEIILKPSVYHIYIRGTVRF